MDRKMTAMDTHPSFSLFYSFLTSQTIQDRDFWVHLSLQYTQQESAMVPPIPSTIYLLKDQRSSSPSPLRLFSPSSGLSALSIIFSTLSSATFILSSTDCLFNLPVRFIQWSLSHERPRAPTVFPEYVWFTLTHYTIDFLEFRSTYN